MPGQSSQSGSVFDPTGKYKLVMEGAFSAVECAITAQDGLKSESGAMLTMSSAVDLRVKLEGSGAAALFRCCCAGESAFFTHYSLLPGMGARGDVLLAPAVPGEITLINLRGAGDEWAIQKGAFLACDGSVNIGVKTQGLAAGCCSGEGFFVLKASGQGRLLVNSYGSIMRYDLQPGETRKIDNGFLVAWQNHMQVKIGKAGTSAVSSFISGEGLVTKLTGPGTVFVQTRSVKALALTLVPYIPMNGGGAGGAGIGAAFG